MILKDAVLKSPQDYAGTAAVIAFWIQCNVSLTSMEMITVERAVELKEGKLWADDKQGNNKWGLYKEQISLVGNEAKRNQWRYSFCRTHFDPARLQLRPASPWQAS